MATTAIAITATLALNSAPSTIDMLGAGTVATTPGDGWVIAAANEAGPRLLVIIEADASGDTVVFTAGDNPPALHAGDGSLSVVLAASDIKAVFLDASRHVQSDGSIIATCTDAGTRMQVWRVPK